MIPKVILRQHTTCRSWVKSPNQATKCDVEVATKRDDLRVA
jgi:hypothetical protein